MANSDNFSVRGWKLGQHVAVETELQRFESNLSSNLVSITHTSLELYMQL